MFPTYLPMYGGSGVYPGTDEILTDGKQDFFWYQGNLFDGAFPINWNFSKDYRRNEIDFQGYRINSFDIQLDSMVIINESELYPDVWGPLVYWDGQWFFGLFEQDTWTLKVDATPVPEPATMLLLGFGLLSLWD